MTTDDEREMEQWEPDIIEKSGKPEDYMIELPDVVRVVPGLITTKPWEPSLGVAFALIGFAVAVGMGIAWLVR